MAMAPPPRGPPSHRGEAISLTSSLVGWPTAHRSCPIISFAEHQKAGSSSLGDAWEDKLWGDGGPPPLPIAWGQLGSAAAAVRARRPFLLQARGCSLIPSGGEVIKAVQLDASSTREGAIAPLQAAGGTEGGTEGMLWVEGCTSSQPSPACEVTRVAAGCGLVASRSGRLACDMCYLNSSHLLAWGH